MWSVKPLVFLWKTWTTFSLSYLRSSCASFCLFAPCYNEVTLTNWFKSLSYYRLFQHLINQLRFGFFFTSIKRRTSILTPHLPRLIPSCHFLYPKRTRGTSSVTDRYFCSLDHPLKWEERWIFSRCGCSVGTPKGTNTLARCWGPQTGPQQGSGTKCLWAHGLVLGP